MAKTNFKMVHYNQNNKIDSPLRTRNPQVELKKDPTHMVLWTKFFKVLDKEDQGSNQPFAIRNLQSILAVCK